MRDFFKPWRRKAGCVTLVVACVFAVGWVRSEATIDLICHATPTYFIELASDRGSIAWSKTTYLGVETPPSLAPPKEGYSQWPTSDFPPIYPFDLLSYGWERQSKVEGVGFLFASAFQGEIRIVTWRIPYWLFVIPLTLLSAYLLLSKPRPATAMKPSEPVPAEGG